VAAAKQEIAGCPNQGCRANTNSSHFGGSNLAFATIVSTIIFGFRAEGRQSNHQTSQ
jgi:hypothetical protein